MRNFGHIKERYDGKSFALYINNEYKGTYYTREEAEEVRESYREIYEPVEVQEYVPVFYDRLITAIGKTGRSTSSICRQAHISTTSINRYLKGGMPNMKALIGLSVALNVSTDWLLGLKGDNT